MPVSESVREAWRVNTRVNRALLDHLTPDMLNARTPGGGYTVAQQLAHIAEVQGFWGGLASSDLAGPPPLGNPDGDPEGVATDPDRVAEVVDRLARAGLEAAEGAADTGDLPHTSLDAYLVHMMVHDAHHRGQVLLALKTAGHPLPDEDDMWGPWRGE